jgi:hypothetical protein
LTDKDTVVGIHPLAGTPIRCWPYYDRLARKMMEERKARVIFFGTASERGVVDELVRKSGEGAVGATHFDLQTLMAALCRCDVLVCNDSGPMHLASLLDRKVVALFGPTSSIEVGPWNQDAVSIQALSCGGCYLQTCEHPPSYCMNEIGVNEVADSVHRIIQNDSLTGVFGHLSFRGYPWKRMSSGKTGAAERILLRFFEARNGQSGSHFLGPGSPIPNDRRSFHQLEGLEALARRGLGDLQHSDPNHWRTFSSLIHTESFIKPVVVLNDLQWIDKRIDPVLQDGACSSFYQGVLKDVALVKTILKENKCQQNRTA